MDVSKRRRTLEEEKTADRCRIQGTSVDFSELYKTPNWCARKDSNNLPCMAVTLCFNFKHQFEPPVEPPLVVMVGRFKLIPHLFHYSSPICYHIHPFSSNANFRRNMDRIMRLPEVIQNTGLSKSSIYKLMELGEFPRQLRLGPRSVGWRQNEIANWIDIRK